MFFEEEKSNGIAVTHCNYFIFFLSSKCSLTINQLQHLTRIQLNHFNVGT